VLDRFLDARPSVAHVDRPCVAAKRVSIDQVTEFGGEAEQMRLSLLDWGAFEVSDVIRLT
jgi:hypothetical protein